MLHQVSLGVSSFNRCLEFSLEFFQIFVSPSDILLAMSEVHPPRELTISLFLIFRSYS